MRNFTRFAMMMLLAGSAWAANAESLSVDAVQAANLDSYYGTHGQWELVFVNEEQVVATVNVTTSGYNHIAGSYSLEGTTATVIGADGTEQAVTEGVLTVEYAGAGENFPEYHFEGTLVTEQANYTIDVTTEVFAYDYLYYQYYEMGYFSYEMILIVLDDAPEDAEHETYELTMTSGNCIDYIASMGALQFTAENEDGLYMQVIVDADALTDNTTYQMSQGYAIYCYLANLNTQIYEAYFKSGEVKLTVVADDTVSLDCTLTAKGGDVYHIVVPECHAEGVVYEGTTDAMRQLSLGSLTAKRWENGRLLLVRDGMSFDANGLRVDASRQ